MNTLLGVRLESEIREQPQVWRRIAATAHASAFADAVRDRAVVLVGSGSSLFVAMLGALAERADVVIDVDAGTERAVPATKSVTAMVAVVLWGAALTGGATERNAASLHRTADDVEAWLASDGARALADVAQRIARRRSVAVVGAGYGVPIAFEFALKLKEAAYLHAEGFAAGEFRHGSSAMLDASTALAGIVDDASRAIVQRPLDEAKRTGSLRLTIGEEITGIARFGPQTPEAFNTLAWLVAGQVLALEVGRARGIDGDAPRGLTKFVV